MMTAFIPAALSELARKLTSVGNEVFVVAPRTEQSGISSAITFLRPLFPVTLGSSTESGDEMQGFSVDGTPADCTKLALFELCPFQPDLVISGINGGLNAGTNVGYSGTGWRCIGGGHFQHSRDGDQPRIFIGNGFPRRVRDCLSTG